MWNIAHIAAVEDPVSPLSVLLHRPPLLLQKDASSSCGRPSLFLVVFYWWGCWESNRLVEHTDRSDVLPLTAELVEVLDGRLGHPAPNQSGDCRHSRQRESSAVPEVVQWPPSPPKGS